MDFLNEELDCTPEGNETDSEEDYDEDLISYLNQTITTIFVQDTTHLCMHIHTDEFSHSAIMDSGADTCVIGQG